jgi:hypothetical protein
MLVPSDFWLVPVRVDRQTHTAGVIPELACALAQLGTNQPYEQSALLAQTSETFSESFSKGVKTG